MNAIVDKALPLWGLDGARYHLAAARENQVFQVTKAGATYALRMHRPAYRRDSELTSELGWMAAIKSAGISVPTPLPAVSGAMLQSVNGVQVDLLEWLPGEPLDASFDRLPRARRQAVFRQLGQDMATFHTACDAWEPPRGFTRPVWDRDGLLGSRPLWDRFWENPTLDASDRMLLAALRKQANANLAAIEETLDYGLIHADLVAQNVMLNGNQISFIDFDDGGFGFRLFELATALVKHLDAADYPDLRAALIAGYRAKRALDTDALDLFILLRAATYVGWIISRLDEDQAKQRNARFITTTRHLARAYFAQKGIFLQKLPDK